MAPLQLLAEKASVSDHEVTAAIERAQVELLREFAQVCTAIRAHYQGELPRFVSLPSLTSPAMMAAE